MIIELFSLDTHFTKDQIFYHYYNDVGICNDAIENQILKMEMLTNPKMFPNFAAMDSLRQFEMYAGAGLQRIPKGRSNLSLQSDLGPSIQNDDVLILFFVVRIPIVQTDIAISMNIPYSSGASSPVHLEYVSWLRSILATRSISDILTDNSNTPSFERPLQVGVMSDDFVFPTYEPLQAFRRALASFTIRNWSLFA